MVIVWIAVLNDCRYLHLYTSKSNGLDGISFMSLKWPLT